MLPLFFSSRHNNQTIGILARLIVLFLFTLAFRNGATTELPVVRVGVLTKGNLEFTLRAWPATIEKYLGENIPDYQFKMVPLGFSEIGPAVARNEIDFVLTNSASYVELEVRYGVGRVATIKHLWRDNIHSTVFGAVLLTRRDNKSIRQLSDLVGKTFMAVDEKAFGGWTMAWRELKKSGINPYVDFAQLTFAGSHEAVVTAILEGKVDAGTVRTGTLEEMAQNGALDLALVRLIDTPGLHDEQVQEYAFPFLRSTRLYPEWPFAKLRDTDAKLAQRVAIALLAMPENHPAAEQAGTAGWTVPLNYQPVHDLLKELNLSPYQRREQINLVSVWRTYRPWLIASIAFILILAAATAWMVRLNRRMRQAKSALEKEARERERTEEVLRSSKERFQNLVESTNDLVWETNARGQFNYVSPQVYRLLGHAPEKLVSGSAFEIIQCPAIAYGLQPLQVSQPQPFNGCESIAKSNTNDIVVLETSGMPYYSTDGVFRGFRGISRDITDRKHTAEALQHEKERAQITLDSITDGVIRTDIAGRIEFMNPAAAKLTGWDIARAMNHPVLDVLAIIDDTSRKQVTIPLTQALQDGRGSYLSGTTLMSRSEHPREYHIELRIAPVRHPQGSIVGSVIIFHDVTEVRRLTREMAYQATHDALTELINRSEFERRVERAIDHARATHQKYVLGYLDLDQFKVVNDTGGHSAGDALLRQLAHHLTISIRDDDILARLGGDEFGLLLKGCTVAEAASIVNNVCRIVKEFRFTWEGKVFQVGVCAGLVEIDEAAGSLTDILSAADSACYVAKEQGRNRVHCFQPDDAAVAQRHGQMQWVHRLKRALEDDRFNLYLEQFKSLNESASQTPHFEILMRLVDEQGNETPPMSFIPAAERYHLMPAVDRWVIAATFQALSDLSSTHPTEGVYAINLSGQSLSDDEFLAFTIQQFDSSGVSPERICFEITETAAIANLNRALRFMSVLKGMGCLFALDDFGSGLSSFAYLKNLPVDYLKIDGSFIQNFKHDAIDRAMVDAINQVGKIMGLKTIAECVIDEATLDLIKGLGIDYAQGYGIGKLQPLVRTQTSGVTPIQAVTTQGEKGDILVIPPSLHQL